MANSAGPYWKNPIKHIFSCEGSKEICHVIKAYHPTSRGMGCLMCLLIFSILLYHVHISYLKIYSHRACHACQETWCYQIPEVTMITPNNNNFFSPCHVHFSFLWPWVCVLLEPSCGVSGNPTTLLDLSFRSPQPLSPLLYRQSSQCTWSQYDGRGGGSGGMLDFNSSKMTGNAFINRKLNFCFQMFNAVFIGPLNSV